MAILRVQHWNQEGDHFIVKLINNNLQWKSPFTIIPIIANEILVSFLMPVQQIVMANKS